MLEDLIADKQVQSQDYETNNSAEDEVDYADDDIHGPGFKGARDGSLAALNAGRYLNAADPGIDVPGASDDPYHGQDLDNAEGQPRPTGGALIGGGPL